MKRLAVLGVTFLALAAPAVAFSRGALSSGDAAGIVALLGFLALIGGMLLHWSSDASVIGAKAAKSANLESPVIK
jgi:hypothetical protein